MMQAETLAAPETAADPPAIVPAADAASVAQSPAPAAEQDLTDKAQKRIDYLTWKTRELERQLQGFQAPPAAAPAPVTRVPTLADFEYDEAKYQTAHAQWVQREIERTVSERLARADQDRLDRDHVSTFQKREASFEAKNPGYRDLVYREPGEGGPAISEAMAAVIADSEHGPELALYLAKNQEVSRQIHDLPDLAAARELGRIEARFSTPAVASITTKTPQVSQAPAPAPKIEATEPAVSKDPAEMSAKEFATWRRRYISRK